MRDLYEDMKIDSVSWRFYPNLASSESGKILSLYAYDDRNSVINAVDAAASTVSGLISAGNMCSKIGLNRPNGRSIPGSFFN